jgi:hypothetical protein
MTEHVNSNCKGKRSRRIDDPAAFSIPEDIIVRINAAKANIISLLILLNDVER